MEIHVPAYNDNIVSLHSDNVNGKCASCHEDLSWLTPLTPMSVVTEKKISIGGLLNWSNTNCPKEHIKNCVADSNENY